MAKKPLQTFDRAIDCSIWTDQVYEYRRVNRSKRWMSSSDLHTFLSNQVRSITNRIIEDEELEDKFQLILRLPRELPNIHGSPLPLGDMNHSREIKVMFGKYDVLRFAGLSAKEKNAYYVKQTKTVKYVYETDIEDSPNEIHIVTTYKPKPKSTAVNRTTIRAFKAEHNIILGGYAEIICKGHISTPGNTVVIEALIKSARHGEGISGPRKSSSNISCTSLKYIVDLEARTLTGRKSGKVVTFDNQDDFFDHLSESLS